MEGTPYDKWRALPFPHGSSVDAVDEAHADLVYWDAMTAEAVAPMVEPSARYDLEVPDFSAGLDDLRVRMVAFQANVDGPEADRLRDYLEYVDALSGVHRWAAESDH